MPETRTQINRQLFGNPAYLQPIDRVSLRLFHAMAIATARTLNSRVVPPVPPNICEKYASAWLARRVFG